MYIYIYIHICVYIYIYIYTRRSGCCMCCLMRANVCKCLSSVLVLRHTQIALQRIADMNGRISCKKIMMMRFAVRTPAQQGTEGAADHHRRGRQGAEP